MHGSLAFLSKQRRCLRRRATRTPTGSGAGFPRGRPQPQPRAARPVRPRVGADWGWMSTPTHKPAAAARPLPCLSLSVSTWWVTSQLIPDFRGEPRRGGGPGLTSAAARWWLRVGDPGAQRPRLCLGLPAPSRQLLHLLPLYSRSTVFV